MMGMAGGTSGVPNARPAHRKARVGERYVMGEQIGAGGLATVHAALDTAVGGCGRAVAIKRLHPQFAAEPDVAATLLDEGRIVGRINHPNVVPLFDIAVEERSLFLVLEYVPGESLSALLRLARSSGRRIPLDVACAIGRDLLCGLHAAHEATDENERPLGVVHCDVSPHNVLVGADGRVRLLDFGIAKAAGQSHTSLSDKIKGKVPYMAPEHLRGGLVTRRSDVYAAAIVLSEMLTLERPFFDPADHEGTMSALIAQRALPPSARAEGVPAALDRVVLRALAVDASERYATAASMAVALEQAHPAASATRVAEWLHDVAKTSLANREALVAAIPLSA
jgi:serine/threonine protein kinase